jgi:hypothetical protein
MRRHYAAVGGWSFLGHAAMEEAEKCRPIRIGCASRSKLDDQGVPLRVSPLTRKAAESADSVDEIAELGSSR